MAEWQGFQPWVEPERYGVVGLQRLATAPSGSARRHGGACHFPARSLGDRAPGFGYPSLSVERLTGVRPKNLPKDLLNSQNINKNRALSEFLRRAVSVNSC